MTAQAAPSHPSRWARHRLVSHTGELELEVHASDRELLLAEAARALAEVMAGEAPLTPAPEEQHILLRADDDVALMVAWLNELIFLSDTNKCVYNDVRVRSANEGSLEAWARGAVPAFLRTAVKAATLHRACVERTPRGMHARVVLDV